MGTLELVVTEQEALLSLVPLDQVALVEVVDQLIQVGLRHKVVVV